MRLGVLTTALAVFLLAGFPFAATAGPSPDMDSDGTIDVFDLCKLDPNVPSGCGLDDDKDGYGNGCDCDLNKDGITNGLDFALFLPCFLSGSDPGALGCDLNCDTIVNGLDVALFIPHFLAGTPPGPSGLPCAGTVPCHP